MIVRFRFRHSPLSSQCRAFGFYQVNSSPINNCSDTFPTARTQGFLSFLFFKSIFKSLFILSPYYLYFNNFLFIWKVIFFNITFYFIFIFIKIIFLLFYLNFYFSLLISLLWWPIPPSKTQQQSRPTPRPRKR